MNAVESGYVEVPGARLWYDVRGEGPAVLFTHAGIADHRMWGPQLEPFVAAGHRVVRWDIRTFGLTTSDATPFSTRADLLAILDHLGLERAAFVGCSMGGGVTLSFAIEHPERVGALVLIAPGVAGFDAEPTPVERAAFDEGEAAYQAKDWAAAADVDVRIWVDGVGQGPERVDPRVRELVRTMCLDTYRLDFPDAEHLGLQPPAAERLDSVRAPTLLLLGELDVSGCAAAIGFLAAGIEGSRRVDFPNATHLPNLEQPEAFNRVVLEFLAERGL